MTRDRSRKGESGERMPSSDSDTTVGVNEASMWFNINSKHRLVRQETRKNESSRKGKNGHGGAAWTYSPGPIQLLGGDLSVAKSRAALKGVRGGNGERWVDGARGGGC